MQWECPRRNITARPSGRRWAACMRVLRRSRAFSTWGSALRLGAACTSMRTDCAPLARLILLQQVGSCTARSGWVAPVQHSSARTTHSTASSALHSIPLVSAACAHAAHLLMALPACSTAMQGVNIPCTRAKPSPSTCGRPTDYLAMSPNRRQAQTVLCTYWQCWLWSLRPFTSPGRHCSQNQCQRSVELHSWRPTSCNVSTYRQP